MALVPLPFDQQLEVRENLAQGETALQLAREYGASRQTIMRIR
jgi:uncharacterized protein YerC